MGKRIPDIARQGIIDKLLLIGSVPGRGTYKAFFERTYPESANIMCDRRTTLLDSISRHCDVFQGDWGDDEGIFSVVEPLKWTDEQFMTFCKEYVNPVFTRVYWNEDEGISVDLQPQCVDAINQYLVDCGYKLEKECQIGDKVQYRMTELEGVKGKIQSIVFAATMKPDILLTDVLNQSVLIPENENNYLLYDQEIGISGLSWNTLNSWYHGGNSEDELVNRLFEAVRHCGSPIEEKFFSAYLEFVSDIGGEIPALLPQVYLYYDSKTQKERTLKIFEHQCMDFLMVFSDSKRVVIELDGVQHYGEAEPVEIPGRFYPVNIASPSKYAMMVSAQREMTLAGYEVYRFGGSELNDDENAKLVIKNFLYDLMKKHGLLS